MTAAANHLRGEVDIVLDSTPFVLRPSYEAQIAIEAQTGKAIVALFEGAADSNMTLTDAAVVVTECIQQWGRSAGNAVAANVDRERIGHLISEVGLMAVLPRIAMVLGFALTGGCKADGSPKEGEAEPATEMTGIPVAGLQESPEQPSAGRRTSSGARRRTSSGPRSKSGKK